MEMHLFFAVLIWALSYPTYTKASHHKSISSRIHRITIDSKGTGAYKDIHLFAWRGGASETDEGSVKQIPRRKKKSHQKSKKKTSKQSKKDDSTKTKLNQTMKRHKDTASMLGDAIRDRADDLIRNSPASMFTKPSFTFNSLGLALGATGTQSFNYTQKESSRGIEEEEDDDSGGVEAASSAVLANYFLHTHGGAHGIQSILSLSSVVTGIGALISPTSTVNTVSSSSKPSLSSPVDGALPLVQPNFMKLMFIRRTLLFAGLKHVSGIVSAVLLSARQIPELGLTQVRQSMEQLIQDPVAQYFVYCSLMLFWTGIPPEGNDLVSSSNSNNNNKSPLEMSWNRIPWWLQSSTKHALRGKTRHCLIATLCIVGPIVIREFVSIIWVLSDVLVILSSNQPYAFQIWKLGRSVVDAFMSILFTPNVWRNSNLVTRQKLLAELVSRISLLLEVLMGIIIVVDAMKSFWKLSLAPMTTRSSFWRLIQRLVCAKLYTQFLLVRKQRISDLMTTIRGGAVQLPDRVLDTLLDPKKAMGLDMDMDKANGDESFDHTFQNAIKWIGILLGF